MAIATLSVRLQAQIAEFQAEFKEAARSTEKFQENFEKTATKSVAWGTLIARGLEIGIGAVQQLGEAAFENASTIDDLSKKTGLSMRTIQEFQHVAGETGATVDQFANAAFRLGTNLAGGDKSVVGAVEDLGLAFKDVKEMRVDEQFRTIIAALEDMEDQQEANRLGVILFGRSYKEMAVAVAEGYSDLADGARVMSDDQVKRLADAEDAWKRFGRTAVIVSGEMLASVIKSVDLATRSWKNFFETLTPAGQVRVQMSGEDVGPPKAPAAPELFKPKALATLQQELLDLVPQKTLEGLNAPIKAVKDFSAEIKRADIRSLADDIQFVAERSDDLGAAFDRAATEAKEMGDDLQSLRDDIRNVDEALSETDAAFWADEQKEALKSLRDDIALVAEQIETPPDVSKWDIRLEELTERLKDIGLRGARTFAEGIADGIRTGDWGAAGQAFEDAMGQMMADGMAAAVNFIVPGLGDALQPIFDAISEKITGAFDFNEGRDLVQDFAKSFGGFDALHARLLEMGDAGEVLWKKLTQGVGRDNPAQAKAVIDEITKALDAFGTEAERAALRVAGIGSAIDAINTKATAFASPFRELLSDEDAEDVKAKLAAIGEVGQAEFERIGTFAAAAFAGLVKETGDAIGAIQQLGPTFQVLQEGVEQFGLTSTGTIDALIGMFSLVNDAVTGPIFQAIQTTGQIFAGLQEGGILTAELFQTVATDIGASFRELEAKGGDVAKAMALSQPVLQRLWEAQQLYGEVTDETTQKILDQAEQQGLVGDHMKDVNRQILEVLIAIADVFGADIPAGMRATRDAATQTAADIEREFAEAGRGIQEEFNAAGRGIKDQLERNLGTIKVPNIQVDVDFNVGKLPNPDFTRGVPALASGGIVRRPTLALVGEAGPEAVIPLSQLGSVAPERGDSTVIFEIDGRQIAAATVPYLPGQIRRYVPA